MKNIAALATVVEKTVVSTLITQKSLSKLTTNISPHFKVCSFALYVHVYATTTLSLLLQPYNTSENQSENQKIHQRISSIPLLFFKTAFSVLGPLHFQCMSQLEPMWVSQGFGENLCTDLGAHSLCDSSCFGGSP